MAKATSRTTKEITLVLSEDEAQQLYDHLGNQWLGGTLLSDVRAALSNHCDQPPF